jgi:VanZ family protein
MENSKKTNHTNTLIVALGVAVTVLTWSLGMMDFESTAGENSALLAVGIGWILWLIVCLIHLVRSSGSFWILRPIIALCVILIIGLTLENATIKYLLYPINFALDWFSEFIGSFRRYVPSAGKIGHVVVFFALSLNLLKIREILSANFVGVTCFVALVAVATEGLQLFVPTRTSNSHDLLYDGFGIFLALIWVLAGYLRCLYRRK